jgi:L-asparagine transporter-like permease
MAGNGIAFAEYFLAAIGAETSNNAVRGVAVGIATLACLLHGIWRKGGIYLNNFFGIIKILILVMIFVVGVCAAAGVFTAKAIAKDNLNVHHSFSNSAAGSYGYSEAFLGIIFAFGGFNQANYVSLLFFFTLHD